MPIRRELIDWRRPALTEAARWLLDRYTRESTAHLSDVLVAVPGRQAGRRLLEMLVEQAEDRGVILVPPQIVTAGQLPEELYQAQRPFADSLTQQLAWITAIRETPAELVAHVFPNLPDQSELSSWLALGDTLARLHRELAADAHDFDDVTAHGRQCREFGEFDRWKALEAMRARYLHTLDELGLWDRQSARLYAIEHRECRTDCDIVLLATVDMNRAQRQMLDQVADRVTALIFADPADADAFDEHGCLLPEQWKHRELNVPLDIIDIVDGPGDQADAVVRAIAEYDGKYAAEQITVGVPDERIIPAIQQRLDECDVPARYGVGGLTTLTPPCTLLDAVADVLDGHSFPGFAALLRHPDLELWLRSQGATGDWLSELDDYYSGRLPSRVPSSWDHASLKTLHTLPDVHRRVNELLSGLGGAPRPLGEWGEALSELLLTIYGGRELEEHRETDRTVIRVCDQLQTAWDGFRQIPASLSPPVTAAEAIHFTLDAISDQSIAPPASAAIELLGWLELPLDDAPALIVTGMNEGIVPSSRNGDLFLPNELRRHLQLEDNDRRYARDAYALSLLVASRESLRLIAGRRSAGNDPLNPSRLLLSCPDDEIAERTLALFAETTPGPVVLPGTLRPGVAHAAFAPPPPWPLSEPVTSMRVTEFRDYLACPYRYYLRHRLGLGGMGDAIEELGPAEFGTLLHNTLKRFGDHPGRNSTNESEIRDILNSSLDREVAKHYGDFSLPAVRIQVELLRMRLAAFAEWQADWARQGWVIHKAEFAIPKDRATLIVDDQPMALRGRIDRIDVNADTGEFIVFDYKSGDSAADPEKSHRSGDEWTDLQLPLYWHSAPALNLDRPPRLGYIRLPKQTDKTGAALAEWTEDDLRAAVRVAEEVVRNIRAEKFWKPADPPPAFSEDFAAICGDGRFAAVFSEPATEDD